MKFLVPKIEIQMFFLFYFMDDNSAFFRRHVVYTDPNIPGGYYPSYVFLFSFAAGALQIQLVAGVLRGGREQHKHQDDQSEQKKCGSKSESDCHCFVSRSVSPADGTIITLFRYCQNSQSAGPVSSRLAASVHRSVLLVESSEGALFCLFCLRLWGASNRSNLSTSRAQRSRLGTWWMRDVSISSEKWIRARYFASWKIPQTRARGTRKKFPWIVLAGCRFLPIPNLRFGPAEQFYT